jgi:hypothetical protein
MELLLAAWACAIVGCDDVSHVCRMSAGCCKNKSLSEDIVNKLRLDQIPDQKVWNQNQNQIQNQIQNQNANSSVLKLWSGFRYINIIV